MCVLADGAAGGGTTHVLQLFRGLADRVDFGFLTEAKSVAASLGAEAGVKTRSANFWRGAMRPAALRAVRDEIERFAPDCVHAHGGRAAWVVAAAGCRVPIIYTVHGLHFAHRSGWSQWLGAAAQWWTMKRTRAVIFVSEHDRARARRWRMPLGGGRARVIHNGIRAESVPAARGPHRWDIGFVGRLEDVKDPNLFVDVLERLPAMSGVIVGGGSLERDVASRAASNAFGGRVTLLGATSHAESLAALAQIGVLVMTSRAEGLPLVLLEAMAAGVPIVAPAVGGIPEVVTDGETGLLLRTRDPAEFASAAARVRGDANLRARLVANGRKRVEEVFSESAMLEKTMAVYAECAPGAVASRGGGGQEARAGAAPRVAPRDSIR
ncbi:MAG: glycosyltransferase family 4 protein [bacterium]